jgi:hypothetical protein
LPLTVILDTDGNIFGGFTPVQWESSKDVKFKADPPGKRFLSTMKDPHNVPARRFALKADEAISFWSACGANFRDLLRV